MPRAWRATLTYRPTKNARDSTGYCVLSNRSKLRSPPRQILNSKFSMGILNYTQTAVAASMAWAYCFGRAQTRFAGAAQVLLELPVTAGTGLACQNEIEAGHKRDELTAGAGLLPRIGG